MPTLSVLVPAYDEAPTIQGVLGAVRDAPLPDGVALQLVVVDDGSKDATAAEVEAFQAENPDVDLIFLRHEHNRGKGAAIHTAVRRAGGEYLVVQDADLEYDPREIQLLLEPILADRADVVYGSRFMGGKPHRILFFWHSIGNRFLTFLSNASTNLNLTDMETCYKMFRADILKGLPLREERFGFEPEVTARVSRIPDIRLYEIGISYYGRTYAEGKKVGWRDGMHAMRCILKYGLFGAR